MTQIITSIAHSTSEKMRIAALDALVRGSDLVELRLDALEDPQAEIASLAEGLPAGRWIATVRTREEGGRSTLSAAKRSALLDRCAEFGAGWIDWEHSSSGFEADSPSAGEPDSSTRLIVSTHAFDNTDRDWRQVADDIGKQAPNAVVKLAWMADDISQNFTALQICRTAPGKRIAICMGEKGAMSRLLAGKCQSFGTFCAATTGAGTAPGQVSLSELRQGYRLGRQTPETHVFGVIGSPVAHSLSPLLFNTQFERDNMDAVYLPLLVDSKDELIRFLDECRRTDWLHAAGFSVTIPHKRSALEWADQHDPLALRIGAANTLSFDGGISMAHNTDYRGLVDAVVAGLDIMTAKLSGMRVAVLGAGGAARAAVAGLCDQGCSVCIFNRTLDRAESLAGQFDCTAKSWDDRLHIDADLVINCTSVGLWPQVDDTPLPIESIPSSAAVMDTVYRPIRTRLLRDAETKGCVTIDGAEMFVRQAAVQYEIWTKRAMDIDKARQTVLDALRANESDGSQ